MISTKRNKTAEWLSLLLVILLSGLTVLYIGRRVLAYADFPFDFDEANHANGALALFLELRAGDIGGFFSELYGQGFYPPGFSWLKAVAFLLFGPNVLTGRLFRLLCLFLACLVIYFLAREIDKVWGWLAGLVAAAPPPSSPSSPWLAISGLRSNGEASLYACCCSIFLWAWL